MLYIYLFLKSIQPANQVLQAMSRLTVTKPSLKQHGSCTTPNVIPSLLCRLKAKNLFKKKKKKQTTPKQT